MKATTNTSLTLGPEETVVATFRLGNGRSSVPQWAHS